MLRSKPKPRSKKNRNDPNDDLITTQEINQINEAVIQNYREAYKELVEQKYRTTNTKKINYDIGENTDTEDSEDYGGNGAGHQRSMNFLKPTKTNKKASKNKKLIFRKKRKTRKSDLQ